MISIIVPIYNVENYLKRCIDSLITQSLEDIEIILVNDGSTDSSGKICDDYALKDKRIKVIHKENGGLSDARNRGIDTATGRYISFIDGDDFIDKDMLKILFEKAEKYGSCIVSCDYIKFKDEKNIININKENFKYKIYNNIDALSDYLSNTGDGGLLTTVCNKIYKKELFNDIRFPLGKIYEDGYITYKLIYNSKLITKLDCKMYYYYQRDGSIMNSNFSEKELLSYDDWKEIFHFVYNHEKQLSKLAAERYIQKHINIYNELTKMNLNIDIIKKYKRKIKGDLKDDYNILINSGINSNLKINLMIFMISNNLCKIYYKIINRIK